jgi:hypothetical protein
MRIEVLKTQLADDLPSIRMNQIENFTKNALLTGRLVNGKFKFSNRKCAVQNSIENISDAQIQSQIDILSRRFLSKR